MRYNRGMDIRKSNANIHRDAWVEVNLTKLANNIEAIKAIIPQGKDILAVIKADAYGHGATMCAPILLASGVKMLGVASVDEGLDLRKAKINAPILVLGTVPVWAIETAVKNDIQIPLFTLEQLSACEALFSRTGIKTLAHIKLDTGMNRIGVDKNIATDFIKKVQQSEAVTLKGIFTHLANAEDKEKTRSQIEMWNFIMSNVETKGLALHILNTAGLISYDVKSDMVRAGIALYGLYPDLANSINTLPVLVPVMGLKGRITNIHNVKSGEGVSYGYTYVADKDTKVATIPIGYADGVSRSLSNKIYGMLNGVKVKQIGNITMDQMMFDITGVDAKIGDVIELLNDELTIDEWAKILNTINYELTCRLKVRLPRVYVR